MQQFIQLESVTLPVEKCIVHRSHNKCSIALRYYIITLNRAE